MTKVTNQLTQHKVCKTHFKKGVGKKRQFKSKHKEDAMFKMREVTQKKKKRYLKVFAIGAGEMAQWLRALALPLEDPGSVANNHMPTHNYL